MDGSQGVGDNALPVPSSSVTDAATAAVSSVAIAPPLAPAAPAPVSTAATQPSDFVNIKEQLVCQNPISVEPSEVSYYLPPALSDSDDAKLKDKRSSSTKKQGKVWIPKTAKKISKRQHSNNSNNTVLATFCAGHSEGF